jgi:hypothetical protein
VRRQYFAERESAGGTSIHDEPLHFLERLNPGHLFHRGLAPRTAICVLVRDVRLECHCGVYLRQFGRVFLENLDSAAELT